MGTARTVGECLRSLGYVASDHDANVRAALLELLTLRGVARELLGKVEDELWHEAELIRWARELLK